MPSPKLPLCFNHSFPQIRLRFQILLLAQDFSSSIFLTHSHRNQRRKRHPWSQLVHLPNLEDSAGLFHTTYVPMFCSVYSDSLSDEASTTFQRKLFHSLIDLTIIKCSFALQLNFSLLIFMSLLLDIFLRITLHYSSPLAFKIFKLLLTDAPELLFCHVIRS